MNNYDSIIIGAGAAGLSYASLMAKHKRKILLVEKNKYLAGRAAFRPAKDWNYSKANTKVSCGPHIVPAKAYLEHLLDILDIKHKIPLKPLASPFIYDDKSEKVNEVPNTLNILHIIKCLAEFKYLNIKDCHGLLKLAIIAKTNSHEQLIKKYDSISVRDLMNKHNLKSPEIESLLKVIIESAVLSIDIDDCPAFDLLIMLRLMMNGIVKKNTIMYEPTKGYGDMHQKMLESIKENSPESNIILDKEVTSIITKNKEAKGIQIGNKKYFANEVVFAGTPPAFKKVLEKSKLDYTFLKPTLKLKPAKIYDLMFLSKSKVHNQKTTWIYLLLNKHQDIQLAPVLIEESAGLKDYLYHYCFSISNPKNAKKAVKILKDQLKQIFGYNFEKEIIWSSFQNLEVYGTKKTIKLPFSKRAGPRTPYENLYVIGDSYKCLTTGTDGCAFSAIQLAQITLDKDLELKKIL